MITGDLVFSFIGPANNAISSVTEGYMGARVNHVGILIENTFGLFVLEAFYPEVRLTNIHVFTKRSRDHNGNPRLMFGRLHDDHNHLTLDAVEYGLKQRNIPYDALYLSGEGALYCSELVVDMYKFANDGVPFFVENPMEFTDPETGEIHESWVQYYAVFGMPVPEGHPGSNPGDISRDQRLEIYDIVGEIPGLVIG